ncbi:hypothetical protein [Flavobacterium quisquiliarum]|uniref:Uncharacterized protein n=1 Tax=Flavobacterium quisquiliarum TaxID=1834436 RepID=A0ABV8W1R9_9FLAO|nr:hypothetical protein [Flavobacterium quisquiliarum]MBW1658804.1 hypothetical protein [Flavobacterium quisquiliarum]NWL02953.1 hypothetical protein [Flavobacterium collinsii]
MKHQTNNQNISGLSKEELLNHVKLSINPKFQDWVLFQNGTYIIFDDADSIADIESEAIKLIKEFGPVNSGGRSEDFDVTDLNKTKGWIVSGYGYGIYTYVHPSEIKSKIPDIIEIGLYGRTKRDLDGNTLIVIHINRKLKS